MASRYAQPTRLTRTSEKQNKKQALYFTIASILIIAALVQFGPLIVNTFGNLIYSFRGGVEENNQISGSVVLNPPVLKEIPNASQESLISFKGIAPEKNGTVEIYINDELVDEVEIGDDLNFVVKDILLSPDQNTIKARFVKKDKTSPFSDEIKTSYIKDKPKLEISFPGDNSSFTRADKSITIKGMTDPDNTVNVNGFRAIVEGNGAFSYQHELNDGENTINVEAHNSAGATTLTTLKVTYNP